MALTRKPPLAVFFIPGVSLPDPYLELQRERAVDPPRHGRNVDEVEADILRQHLEAGAGHRHHGKGCAAVVELRIAVDDADRRPQPQWPEFERGPDEMQI